MGAARFLLEKQGDERHQPRRRRRLDVHVRQTRHETMPRAFSAWIGLAADDRGRRTPLDDCRRELPAAGLADRPRTARKSSAAARPSTRVVACLGGAPRSGPGRRDAARRVRYGTRRCGRRDGRGNAEGELLQQVRHCARRRRSRPAGSCPRQDRTPEPRPQSHGADPPYAPGGGPCDVEFLRSITDRRIKITVPGPFTMTQQAQNDYYDDQRSLALAYAAAVNEELHELKAAGADIVQIDEPYLQARPEPAREYAVEAIDRALEGVPWSDRPAHLLRLCTHRPRTPPRLPVPARARRAPARSPRPSRRHSRTSRRRASRRSEQDRRSRSSRPRARRWSRTPDVVAARIRRALEVPPPERLVLAPDCGMKYLPRERAYGKLEALVAGARLVRSELDL